MSDESPPEDFSKLITALSVLYGRGADEPTIYSYWIALHDVPIMHLAEAVRRSMRTCRYFPVPAVLREFACEHARSERDPRLAYTHPRTDRTPETDLAARVRIRELFPNMPRIEDDDEW